MLEDGKKKEQRLDWLSIIVTTKTIRIPSSPSTYYCGCVMDEYHHNIPHWYFSSTFIVTHNWLTHISIITFFCLSLFFCTSFLFPQHTHLHTYVRTYAYTHTPSKLKLNWVGTTFSTNNGCPKTFERGRCIRSILWVSYSSRSERARESVTRTVTDWSWLTTYLWQAMIRFNSPGLPPSTVNKASRVCTSLPTSGDNHHQSMIVLVTQPYPQQWF